MALRYRRPEKIESDLCGGMPMATYEYRCPDCGRFEVRLPIGTAAAACECPACHRPSRRVFSSPYLGRVPSVVSAALTREEQSQEAPEVITSVPAKRREPPPHPALPRLPRP
ncbi:FmdB family zinc ribbon protein [Nonomuraea sp. NPDC050022]|uniref:FmdB family zinc ribbon protein n=1 Tax=Nonomuraea sp. NPDC050022 TaxID=3364358 RepID=UPI00378C6DDB